MSRQRSYQLLDQANVIKSIREAVHESTTVDLSEREARRLKPHLAEVKQDIRDAIDEGTAPEWLPNLFQAGTGSPATYTELEEIHEGSKRHLVPFWDASTRALCMFWVAEWLKPICSKLEQIEASQ